MNKHIPVTYSGHKKYWCGPYALATLLGIEYDEAYMKCLRYKRKREGKHIKVVKLYYDTHLVDLLMKNGSTCDYEYVPKTGKRLNINTVWDHLRPRSVYLIATTSHFLVVDTTDKTLIDNWTCDWVPLEKFHNQRSRVVAIGRVANHKCYLGD